MDSEVLVAFGAVESHGQVASIYRVKTFLRMMSCTRAVLRQFSTRVENPTKVYLEFPLAETSHTLGNVHNCGHIIGLS
jgi:hypothetical protein